MYVMVDKEWWDENSEHFLERYQNEYKNEDKLGYLIDTNEDKLFTQFDDHNWSDSENGHPVMSWNNQGIYVSAKCKITEEIIKDILNSIPTLIPSTIEIITKKFNQVKSLLESAKAL